jgi:DNA-binding protein HU-beta
MNKAELVEEIYDHPECKVSKVTKKDITLIASILFQTIANTVAKNEKVTVVGFGSFEKRDRAARRGRNPKSGEIMEIPAMSVPAFSAGKNFKELVAGE